MSFQHAWSDLACAKEVQKRMDSSYTTKEGQRVDKMKNFSTAKTGHGSGFQPLFAISTGYTITTLCIFNKK
jgi:hypothetical protein